MADLKDKVKDAGQKITDAAKDAGQVVADKVGQAAGWVKDKTQGSSCGTAKSVSDIQPHMEVVSSCGCTMGKVDHLEGGAIKLTKNDSEDGQHHFIPTDWVKRVDEHVHLTKDAHETKAGWKSDAAACGSCGA